MTWKTIDTQEQLDELNQKICWDDSDVIEFYGTDRNEDYFPAEVNRSGYARKNIYISCEVCGAGQDFLQMVWIHCDYFSSAFIGAPHLRGRVDSLKRIEIVDHQGQTVMRCARLIYRLLDEAPVLYTGSDGRMHKEDD